LSGEKPLGNHELALHNFVVFFGLGIFDEHLLVGLNACSSSVPRLVTTGQEVLGLGGGIGRRAIGERSAERLLRQRMIALIKSFLGDA